MADPEPALDETIRELSALLARVYLRLSFPDQAANQLDCPETKSASCDSGLTLLEQRP
jgi:hypothetical protein